MKHLFRHVNLSQWDPENTEYWNTIGQAIARRNLWISIPALLLGFAVWFIWSIVVVQLDRAGFHFTTGELFILAAMPGLSGATLRILYSFTVPIFGGRNWTVFATGILLVPTIGMGLALQNPATSFHTFMLLGILCGLGGGAFSSSMSNISFFFPKHEQGTALGLNAGLGNLGVSVAQFILPLIIAGGVAELKYAGFIWVLPIAIVTLLAYFGMDNLPTIQTSVKNQLVIFKRKHFYLTTILYIESFGSYIGFCAAFPLLLKMEFPEVNALHYVFLGPMIGALIRPFGGWLSDKMNSGAQVTFGSVVLLILTVGALLFFLNPAHKSFLGFFTAFMAAFALTGIANGSVFRMIGVLFPPKEKGPALGFSAAMAAYGAFSIPLCFGYSIKYSGSPSLALSSFIVFYTLTLILMWKCYLQRGRAV